MDDKGRESGHLMLITPERVFYAGLLGRPRERCQGAFNVYVALKGGLWLTTADGGERYGELAGRAAKCPPHHRKRSSLGHLPRDRTGKRSPGALEDSPSA